jgi:transcription initiation factor IIE alpha subunit
LSMTENTVMVCPEGHEMKMGPPEMKSKMMTCDGCGGEMTEMKMKEM